MIYKTYYNSPVGEILIASDGENIIGLWIEGQKYYLDKIDEKIVLKNDLKIFEKTKKWLEQYFNKKKPQISELQLAPKGNEFRQLLW